MAEFVAEFNNESVNFDVDFYSENAFAAEMNPVIKVYPDVYEGSYEYTPTNDTQIVEAKNMTLADNIVINPIPSNYGLISWSGLGIRVS